MLREESCDSCGACFSGTQIPKWEAKTRGLIRFRKPWLAIHSFKGGTPTMCTAHLTFGDLQNAGLISVFRALWSDAFLFHFPINTSLWPNIFNQTYLKHHWSVIVSGCCKVVLFHQSSCVSIKWDSSGRNFVIIQRFKKRERRAASTWMNLEKVVLGDRNSQRIHIIHFHLCKRSGKGNSRDKTDEWLLGLERWKMENDFYRNRTSSKGENILYLRYNKYLHNFMNRAKTLN